MGKLIVGLGNPGLRYRGTRHNVGFEVLDRFAASQAIRLKRSWRYPAWLAKFSGSDQDIRLVKPRTYMNRSGAAVAPMLKQYGLSGEDLVVLVDDLDLACGQLRIRAKGGSGGHRGLASIIEEIGTDAFIRFRIGIGPKPPRDETVRFVLSEFRDEERELLAPVYGRSCEALTYLMEHGLEKTMNRFNSKK